MGLFDGRRQADTGEPHPHMPALSMSRGADLERLVRTALAERGVETLPDGRGALVGSHTTFGLTNLAATVAALPRRRWRAAVAEHIDLVLRVTSDDATDEEGPVLVKLRLVDDLPERPDYAPEVLPGMLALMAIDHPDHVREVLSSQEVAAAGGWDVVRGQAMDNLRRLAPPHHEVITVDDDHPDAVIHIFSTDDFFGAARLMLVDELMAGVGIEQPPYGILVAMPTRHLLVVHVLAGVGVVPTITVLDRFVRAEHNKGPGSVSPHIYHRAAGGRSHQVTEHEDGTTRVIVGGTLAAAFDDLGLIEE